MRGNTCLSRRKDLNDQKHRHIWQRIRVIRLKRRSRFNSFTEWIDKKLHKGRNQCKAEETKQESYLSFSRNFHRFKNKYIFWIFHPQLRVEQLLFTHRECRELLFINVDDLRHVWVLNVFLQLQTKQHQWKKHFTHTVTMLFVTVKVLTPCVPWYCQVEPSYCHRLHISFMWIIFLKPQREKMMQ